MVFVLLLLIMTGFFLYWKWRRAEAVVAPPPPKEPEVVPPPPPANNNYVETEAEAEPIVTVPVPGVVDDAWARQQAEQVMRKFRIDHAHREIVKCIHACEPIDDCGMLYAIFSQCPALSVAKKMEIGVYIIWKSKDQGQIDRVYETILAVASDPQENPRTRANALEILMRSNNRIYMDRSKRIMESLRDHERIGEMERVRQRMERIQNVLQQRAPINPSTLRRQPQAQAQQPNQLQGHVPLTQEEVQVQHALLDQYRRLERRAYNAMKHKANIYDDSQNVHNQKINETVVRSAQELVKSGGGGGGGVCDVELALRQHYPHWERDKEKIRGSLSRIRSDPSKFQGGVTIGQVFDKVVGVVSGSRHKEEMWKRLGEELADMDRLCATGHLSRVVNVLQGFEDVPDEFRIRMDPKDEIYANIANHITMQVQNSGESDKLLESMIDPNDRSLFLEFVSLVLKPKVAELRQEYKGVVEPERLDECVRTAIHNYIKDENHANLVAQAAMS